MRTLTRKLLSLLLVFTMVCAMVPAAMAAAIPFRPPVFGTVTLLAFLMILLLTSKIQRSGLHPNRSRHLAAAYAIEIGSVHPIAGRSSAKRIFVYV